MPSRTNLHLKYLTHHTLYNVIGNIAKSQNQIRRGKYLWWFSEYTSCFEWWKTKSWPAYWVADLPPVSSWNQHYGSFESTTNSWLSTPLLNLSYVWPRMWFICKFFLIVSVYVCFLIHFIFVYIITIYAHIGMNTMYNSTTWMRLTKGEISWFKIMSVFS